MFTTLKMLLGIKPTMAEEVRAFKDAIHEIKSINQPDPHDKLQEYIYELMDSEIQSIKKK